VTVRRGCTASRRRLPTVGRSDLRHSFPREALLLIVGPESQHARRGGHVSVSENPAHANTFEEVQASPEFVALRRRFRNFVFPVTALFLAWYFSYVLLSTYAADFMSEKVFGNITVGLLLGLGQFVSTFAITMWYASWANKKFDPEAEALRDRIEGEV
jgi:uncharacterized membrane protein (DUF485 family)